MQPSQYGYIKLQYSFSVTSGSPSTNTEVELNLEQVILRLQLKSCQTWIKVGDDAQALMLEYNPAPEGDHLHPDDDPDVKVLSECFESPLQSILELADV